MQTKIGKYIFCILFVFLFQLSSAQNIEIKAFLETNNIEIGDQVNLVIEAKVPAKAKVVFPVFKDTIITDIEIIAKLPVDTLKMPDQYIYTQKIKITSFEDSIFQIPQLNVWVDNHEFKTDSIKFAVGLVRLDSATIAKIDTTQMFDIFDIKQPYDAPWTIKEFWEEYGYWILGILLLTGIIAFIIYSYKKRKKNQPIIHFERPKEPAHIIAFRKLDELKQKKLWQQEKIKEYYTELTDIIRVYFEDRFGIPAMESTSNEILDAFKKVKNHNQDCYTKLQEVLMYADLAKFAKYLPLPNENDLCFNHAYFFVDNTKLTAKEKDEQENIETEKNNVESDKIIEVNE